MAIDVESLERATLAAVPPQQLLERPGWLLPVDDGTVGRAHAAVPLLHAPAPGLDLDDVERAYAGVARGAVFRIPRLPAFAPVQARLASAGYAPVQPTLTMTGEVAALTELRAGEVVLAGSPSEAWHRVFLGEGFDPVDAASRLAILRRSGANVYAEARCEGEVVAVGCAGLAHGWCGIHGMRTLPAWRGRGLAAAVIRALGAEARRRGTTRAFLQVEEGNAAARQLYARAGLAQAWGYEYWRRPAR